MVRGRGEVVRGRGEVVRGRWGGGEREVVRGRGEVARGMGKVSKLVFYAQSTGAVISGR